MVWYFIGVYIINSVEKIFHLFAALTCEIFSTLEEKYCISARSCNILYICFLGEEGDCHIVDFLEVYRKLIS